VFGDRIETIFDFNVRWHVSVHYSLSAIHDFAFEIELSPNLYRSIALSTCRPLALPLTPVVAGHPLFPREVVTYCSTTQDSSVTNISPRKHNEAAEHDIGMRTWEVRPFTER
jgi:hypothetical protein